METTAQLNDTAVLLTRAGKLFEAVELFQRAIEQDADNPLLYLNKGVAEQKTGDYEAALGSFETAITLDKDFSDVWAAMGLVYYETGRFTEAEACYQKALSMEEITEKPETWNNLGVLYFNMDRYEDARHCFETAVKQSPFFYDALYNLRDTCVELGDKGAAAEAERLLSAIEGG